MELKITVEDKSITICGSEVILDSLFTLPPWKLPRTESKVKPTVLGCLMGIGEKATNEVVPVFHSEFQKVKDAFQKNLDETGHADNSLTQSVLTPGHFKVVRSVRFQAWKFDIEVSQKEDTSLVLTMLSAEFKPQVRGPVVPQVSKKSLERDQNKNRVTAGNKKLDLLVKKLQDRL